MAAALVTGGAALVVGPSAGAATTTTTGFTTPKVVSGLDASEPGIDVGPDGTLYISAIEGLPTAPADIWRSTNAGSSWSLLPLSLKANLPGGGDVDLTVDPQNGALYETDLWLGDSTASVSSDKGQTWQANPVQGVLIQDRQWVATSGGGIVYHAVHQIPGGIVVSKSVGGLAYPITTLAATPLDQTGCICPPGNLIAQAGTGPAGTTDQVGVIYATSTGGVNFAHSSDGGTTFTNVPVSPASSADTASAFPVVANGGGGHLFAVWQENFAKSTRVRFSSSRNWGASWSAPKTLVSTGTSLYPWVSARGSKVSVSLFHTSVTALPDTAPASAVWYESYLQSTNSGSSFTSLVTADPTAV